MQQLICPRYVIKMAPKHGIVSTFKVYFTINAVMSDVINHWGSHDLIIQPFIRQKHIINPSLSQYHMKSYNGVFKASSVINKTQLDKNCPFYDRLIRSLLTNSREAILQSYDKQKRILDGADE